MSILVCKFGGSSTANAECLMRVRAILDASPGRRCAVLSAPGVDARHGEKVTAQLGECWRLRRDRHRRRALVENVARRFDEIASGLGVAGFYDMAKSEIEAALRVSEAQTVSRGECLCALLFLLMKLITMGAAKLCKWLWTGVKSLFVGKRGK